MEEFSESDKQRDIEGLSAHYQEIPLTPEEYEDTAKDFFRICTEIKNIRQDYPLGKFPKAYKVAEGSQDSFGVYGDFIQLWKCEGRPPVQGIGLGSVSLSLNSSWETNSIQQSLNMHTPFLMDLRLHTDEKTRPTVEEIFKKTGKAPGEYTTWMHSVVLFDETGKLHIVSAIPKSINDPRPSVGKPDHMDLRYVETPITSDKLELVGSALQAVKNTLLKNLPKKPNFEPQPVNVQSKKAA